MTRGRITRNPRTRDATKDLDRRPDLAFYAGVLPYALLAAGIAMVIGLLLSHFLTPILPWSGEAIARMTILSLALLAGWFGESMIKRAIGYVNPSSWPASPADDRE